MKVTLKSLYKTHYAQGEYDGRGIVVLKGSQINLFDSFPQMPNKIKEFRHNNEYVSENGIVLKDIYFSAPSAAAVFVTGRSWNGYIAWRIEDRISLKDYIANSNKVKEKEE